MTIETLAFTLFGLTEQEAIDAVKVAGFVARVVKREWLYCETVVDFADKYFLVPIYHCDRINLFILKGKVCKLGVG